MNFYLEKVNYENHVWKCCMFVTLGIFLLNLLYNFYNDKDDDHKKHKK
jgi:hypothetical protein